MPALLMLAGVALCVAGLTRDVGSGAFWIPGMFLTIYGWQMHVERRQRARRGGFIR